MEYILHSKVYLPMTFRERCLVVGIRLSSIATMILLPVLAMLAASANCSIMLLGDSITAGGEQFVAYGPALASKLHNGGFSCTFVGSQGTSFKNEGYPGKSTEFLAAKIDSLYRANPADIVLLHSGHNHFAEEHPIPGIVASTEAIITKLRIINPQVIVLLAQVIPSAKLPKYSYIPELNIELSKLAARLNTKQQPVILVDQATGFDPRTDTIDDRVHPSARGAEKIAERWYQALVPILRDR